MLVFLAKAVPVMRLMVVLGLTLMNLVEVDVVMVVMMMTHPVA